MTRTWHRITCRSERRFRRYWLYCAEHPWQPRGRAIAGTSTDTIRVGDKVQLATPKGLTTARCELVTLGFTVFRDDEKDEIIVPNSVMVSSTVIRLEQTRIPPPGTSE